jgi:hypothetical protein
MMLLTSPGASAQNVKNGRAVPSNPVAAPQVVVSPVTGRCTAPTTDFRTTNSTDTVTSSTSFTTIPQMAHTFTTAASGCVIVHFAAETFAPRGRVLDIRARLDNTTTATPSDVQLSGDDDEDEDGRWARSHAHIFVFPSVPAGTHTLRMEWRSSGGAVTIHRRTMLMQHR